MKDQNYYRKLAANTQSAWTYRCLSDTLELEVWECRGRDFNCQFVITIHKWGMSVFGDIMFPLVFRVGSDYGLKFLAHYDVSHYVLSKLDAVCRKEILDKDAFFRYFMERIVERAGDEHEFKSPLLKKIG